MPGRWQLCTSHKLCTATHTAPARPRPVSAVDPPCDNSLHYVTAPLPEKTGLRAPESVLTPRVSGSRQACRATSGKLTLLANAWTLCLAWTLLRAPSLAPSRLHRGEDLHCRARRRSPKPRGSLWHSRAGACPRGGLHPPLYCAEC